MIVSGNDVLDIVALGEPMVEFNQTGDRQGRLYLQGFGGDTSNFAIAAARQGARVAYLSALGHDPYGEMLRRLWADEGVNAEGVRTLPNAFTAIYFVTHDASGHQFHFYRQGSAASRMTPADLDLQIIGRARALHFSGISLGISGDAQRTCWHAVQAAQERGLRISFDTNLRLRLWSAEVARPVIERAIGLSDLCLPSLDDITALNGLTDPDAVIDYCHALGAPVVALKLGSRGALISDGIQRWRIAPVPCSPVDATGAGDTFGGALVHRWLCGDDWAAAGRYAAAAAALSTQGLGAVEPIPRADVVMKCLTSCQSGSPAIRRNSSGVDPG